MSMKVNRLIREMLSFFLVGILLFQLLNLRVYATGNDSIPTGNESYISNLKIEVSIDGYWANHYNVRVKLKI